MGDMLSQDEIDALLGGPSTDEDDNATEDMTLPDGVDLADIPFIDESSYAGPDLSGDQKDILGEIGNISMGTSATTLFALLGKKVWITTPVVNVNTWGEIQKSYSRPCVGTRIDYKEGLKGSNILILNERDVKIITNLMMGGDGTISEDEPLNDIDLSAIGEAMNQMIGSSSTSLSSLVKMKIDIDTPISFMMDFNTNEYIESVDLGKDETIVSISFKMEIDGLVDSQIMQILPMEFAIDIVEKIKDDMLGGASPTAAATTTAAAPPVAPPVAAPPTAPAAVASEPAPPPKPSEPVPIVPLEQPATPPPVYMQPQPVYQQPQPMYQQQTYQQPAYIPPTTTVSPAQFQNFDANSILQQKENMDIIMEVPLEISVELGRTSKKIKEILEFNPGTIVELDKLAGEPIDILVNGKFVAKGEVVVVMDENFGVRITDIIAVENRI